MIANRQKIIVNPLYFLMITIVLLFQIPSSVSRIFVFENSGCGNVTYVLRGIASAGLLLLFSLLHDAAVV